MEGWNGMDAGRRAELERKVRAGERLDREDGLALAASDDLVWLGRLAHLRREAAAGDRTTFVIARELDLARVAEAVAAEPAVAEPAVDEPAAAESPADLPAAVVERAVAAVGDASAELRLINLAGLGWDDQLRILRELAGALPSVTVRALTAADLLSVERSTGRPADQLLDELVDAGLGSLAGDGPDAIAPAAGTSSSARTATQSAGTAGWDDWSRIHRLAHARGLRTSPVVRYGDPADLPHLIDQLLRLRDLQDDTGGFASVVPVRHRPDPAEPPAASPVDALRTFAVARLLLDGVPHLGCDRHTDGSPIAALSLNFGVDDLDGAVVAPETGPEDVSTAREDVVELIGDAGFRPVERDTRHRVVREYDAPPSLAQRRSEPQRVWA